MKRKISYIVVIFFGLGFFLSGIQTVLLYYADPSGYGFHYLQTWYFGVSLAIVSLGGILTIKLLKRLERFFW